MRPEGGQKNILFNFNGNPKSTDTLLGNPEAKKTEITQENAVYG